MDWKSVNINLQNIKTETSKAFLFKCPKKSDYSGYCFWHPAKLVRAGRNDNAVKVSYNDEFRFNLKKYGNGRYNRFDVVDEIEINAKTFESMFGVMDSNIRSKTPKDEYETRKPLPVEPVEATVNEALVDE